jgi:hypothetical protein
MTNVADSADSDFTDDEIDFITHALRAHDHHFQDKADPRITTIVNKTKALNGNGLAVIESLTTQLAEANKEIARLHASSSG